MKRKRIVYALVFLAFIAISFASYSYFTSLGEPIKPGLSALYSEWVRTGPETYNDEFNVTVTKVVGQTIYLNYTIVKSLNVTLAKPTTTRNMTVIFEPNLNQTYECLKLIGLPIFIKGLGHESGNVTLYLGGLQYNAAYAQNGQKLSLAISSYATEKGISVIRLFYEGIYSNAGLMESCSIRSIVLNTTVYENCSLISQKTLINVH
mgnify:FL=1